MWLSQPSALPRILPRFRRWLVTVFGTLALGIMPPLANAALLPTPAPGSGSPISPATPNPAQYNFVAGTTISSAAMNSNFYKVYSDINAFLTILNGCSFGLGPDVTSVTATSPISASIGSCSPGTGTNLTLSFSAVGQTLNVGALNSTGNISGPISATTLGVSGAITSTQGDGSTMLSFKSNNGSNLSSLGVNSGAGYPYYSLAQLSSSGSFIRWLMGIDANYNLVLPSGGLSIVGGSTKYMVPFDAGATASLPNTHFEHNAAGPYSVNNGQCTTQSVTFVPGFDSTPTIMLTVDTGGGAGVDWSVVTYTRSASGFGFILCNNTGSNSSTVNVQWLALGE